MKLRISDMMDSIHDDTVKLENSAPLSSSRIKELTMGKITNKKTNKGRRITFRLLVAAAVIASLALTAFAAEEIFGAGDLLRGVLGTKLEEDKAIVAKEPEIDFTIQETISEEQVELVNEIGEVFGPEAAITSNGTTITPIAGYGDENVYVLQLNVVAPEGTVLPDGIDYEFYDFSTTDWDILEAGEDAPYDVVGGTIQFEAMADADPSDNKKDFLFTINGYHNAEAKFNDGYSKLLHITGIYERVLDMNGDADGFVPIVTGDFTFDIGYCNALQMVELDVDGITYGGTKTNSWTFEGEEHSESWEYSVTARALTISALSADWICDYETSDARHIHSLDFQIVMKDGTSPLVTPGSFADSGTSTTGSCFFSVPIDVEQIDYVLIGDPEVGELQKVYLPK